MKSRHLIGAAVAALMTAVPAPSTGQSVARRSPNLLGGWTAPKGVVQLNFLHRFTLSDAPLRKVTNTPTFNVGTGLTDNLMVGFVYGSNSTLVPAYPNEWELYARAVPVSASGGGFLDVSVQGGYNTASESVDGELLVARSLGRVRLLAAGRAFSRAYDSTATRFAVTGGAVLRLTPSFSIAGDVGTLLDRADDETVAWSAGLQLGVPYTPHSFSIQASNVGTASLEGVSRGTRTRWGFEYTIPITLRRYVGGGSTGGSGTRAVSGARGETAAATMPAATGPDTIFVDIHNLAYGTEGLVVEVGTTVVWRNLDPVQHTVVSDGGGFDSGLIDPMGSFAVTFTEPGDYPYHCVPHPFMKARVTVRDNRDNMDGPGGGPSREVL